MTDNIQELLLKIKENVGYVEMNDPHPSVLSEIEQDYLQLAELLKLFLISERDSYYGYFLMNMRFRVDFMSNSIAGIKLNEFPPVFAANPLLLCKFSLKEILYIFCHEIDHVVFNHPTEMVKTNPQKDPEIFELFNIAADAAVNDRLNHEITEEGHSFLSAPKGVITSGVLAEMFHIRNVRNRENYAYYYSLINKRKNNLDGGFNGQQSILQGKLTDGEKENNDSVVSCSNMPGGVEDHNWEMDGDGEDTSAAVRELVNAAVGMMNEETRGMMPGDFMSQVKVLNSPPVICWEKMLKKYVGTIVAERQKTRTRLNRRQPERFDLSGTIDSKILKIVVAIDTSASMDDDMISEVLNEIFAILAKRKHDITIIECDSEVQRVYKARNAGDIQTKMKGRGGTWFTPVIEYVNDRKYYRDALLIYFTDGFGEEEIPRPKTYRNIWVVMGNADNLSLDKPYGVVVPLK